MSWTWRLESADGTPLPAEQFFVTDFTSLQQTGDNGH